MLTSSGVHGDLSILGSRQSYHLFQLFKILVRTELSTAGKSRRRRDLPLISVPRTNHLGNLAPARTVNVKGVAQSLVFLPGPGALTDVVGYVVVPSLSAVLVIAPREVGGNFTPVDGTIRGRFC